jgi:single-stranded DNA-binding protein
MGHIPQAEPRKRSTAMANNLVTFEGNLASDLNLRYTSTGKQVASVNLIHNHTRKNAEGK